MGIDFGTSGARRAVIDRQGHLLDQASLGFAQDHPETLAATWRTVLFELVADVPLSLQSGLQRIAIDGTSATVLLCDTLGQPLLPPLLYNDARAIDEAVCLQSIVPPEQVVLSASSSLAKLLWFSHQPEFSQAHYLLHQADWLGLQLHGQPGISDYHNSLKLGYDPAALEYPDWFHDPALADLRPLLPEVKAPGRVIGSVKAALVKQLGIPSTCQVCAGTTDSIAAFLASGLDQPGQAVTSLGSTLVLKLLSRSRVENHHHGIYSHRFGDLWLVGGASNVGTAILGHYFSEAELVSLSQQIDPELPSPLDYYPLLSPGERFPINDPGLAPRLSPRPADPVAFLAGLLESLARIEAEGYRLLVNLGADPLTQVMTAGGGAQNPTWSAIRQRHLGVSVKPADHTQAAYGAAILARGLAAAQSE